jgi:hypothetical protein
MPRQSARYSELLGCHTACPAGDKMTFNWNMVNSAISQCKKQSATLRATNIHVLKHVWLVWSCMVTIFSFPAAMNKDDDAQILSLCFVVGLSQKPELNYKLLFFLYLASLNPHTISSCNHSYSRNTCSDW